MQQVMIIKQFTATFTAGVERRIANAALPVQGQQPKAFPFFLGWNPVLALQPVGHDLFGKAKQFIRRRQRILPLIAPQILQPLLNLPQGFHARPFCFNNSLASETFSWMPSLRRDKPSARPSSWVKYNIFGEVLMPNSVSART